MMVMLLSMELMFFSLVLNFIFLSSFTDQTLGQIYSLLIIATAASETVIGLGLLIVVFRLSNKIDYKSLVVLRG
jgi:NADH:ubiquinone oxidoreductase subunit K